MMPITEFLPCTRVFDELKSLSPTQRHHAKTYATGLVTVGNKTVAGIAREVLPAKGKRALNKFLTECNWDGQQFNHCSCVEHCWWRAVGGRAIYC
jgi:hypothetical protein